MALSIGGAVKNTGATSTRSIDIPSGIQDGDYWLILCAQADDIPAVVAPSGFDTVYNGGHNIGIDRNYSAFAKHYFTAPTGAVNITGGAEVTWVTISCYVRGGDSGTFLSGTAGTATDNQNMDSPVATAPNAGGSSGDIVVSTVCTAAAGCGVPGLVAPTGMTLLAEYKYGDAAGNAQIAAAWEAYADDTAHTFTNAANARDWSGISFTIQAGSGAPTGQIITVYQNDIV